MPDFVLHRNYALRSLTGHMINFVKGEPTWVPPGCVKEAVAIGALAVDGEQPDVIGEEKVETPAPGGEERSELIFAAFEELEKRNEREDFTAAGSPTVAAMERELGFKVDTKELRSAWIDYRQKKVE